IPRNSGTEWNYVIQAPNGCQGRIVGASTIPTGSVAMQFPPDGARVTVAYFGEYSNPLDVRFDEGSCRLYVRSRGSPLFTERAPIWLTEFDLRLRREVQRAIVDPQALVALCPDSAGAGSDRSSMPGS